MSTPRLLNVTVGDYRLVDFIGAGGMGEVYRAVHVKTGRVAAVKILTLAGHGADFAERFRNEARIQSRLRHPNITAFYDFRQIAGQPCIVMEYVDGQTLAERIRRKGPLPLSEALHIFKSVTQALAYMHRQGIIHRDLKPTNIRIRSTGEVKLLDFGIARAEFVPRLTRAGDVIGTLQYLAPEQLKGEPADARADVWALGIVLYEMATGNVPFEATSISALYERINKGTYIPARTINGEMPRWLESIIARCLHKKPAQRYPSAEEVLAAVELLQAAPVAPEPPEAQKNPPPKREPVNRAAITKGAALPATVALLLILAGRMLKPSQPPALAPVPAPILTRSDPTPAQEWKPVRIDVVENRVGVFRNGEWVATTPYMFSAPMGARVDLLLRREGFVDRAVNFEVNGSRNDYVYTMEKIKKD